MTGNPSIITIFQHQYLQQLFTFMDFIATGPFQIINSDNSKPENNAKGHQWPKQELIKYAVYLAFSAKSHSLELDIGLNFWPFFRKLSIFVQTKNPNQCRIFHKKMMTDHQSIHSLITKLKSNIHKFQEWEQHYESSLVNLQSCLNRQRDEAQKQLTNKMQTVKDNPQKVQEIRFEADELKKNEDLVPTDVCYKEDKKQTVINPENYSLKTKDTRKSFDCSLFQESGLKEDFSVFSFKPRSQTLNNPQLDPFGAKNLKLINCNNSFLSYMSQLQDLMGRSKDY